MSERGENLITRADAAFQEQEQHLSLWREAASYCLPRKVFTLNGSSGTSRTPYTPDPKLQNAVAAKAAQNLAAGMLSAFMNASEIWAQWEPSDFLPDAQKTDKVYQFFSNATRITMRLLGPAGFYSRIYETILDSIGIGTGTIEVQGPIPGSDSPLNFKSWDIGSYAIAENCAGTVDRAWRKMPYTISQARQEWPDFNPRTWKGVKPENQITKEEVYYFEISPRDERDVGQVPGAKGKPYQAIIVHEPTKDVVWEGGFDEFPAIAYRFHRFSASSPWGTGPGIEALPDGRSTNFLDAALADGIGKSVDPPMIVQDDMRGVLDFRMGGVSAVSSIQKDMPQKAFDVGNIQYGIEFQNGKKKELRDHFYNDLFTPFLNDPRTLKATQVMEISKDVLQVFAPFGHRLLEELVTRILERIFMVLLRQGLFGPVPREAILGDKFLYPKTVHQSRMALEIQNLAKVSIRQLINDMVMIGQVRPDALDYLNIPQTMRLLGGNSVVMPNIILSQEEVMAIQQARMQQQQQQAMEENLAKFATKNPDHAAAALANVA